MILKSTMLILLSYVIGCLNTGYYYTKMIYKDDIRAVGTGVTGAVNVSRKAGKKGFIITFLGDALKGVLVVLSCRLWDLTLTATMLCILAVVAGHIFPFQLEFRGGKGISTAFGAFLAFNPISIVTLFVLCVIIFPFVRRFTITSLIALLVFPVVLLIYGSSLQVIGFFFLYAFVINFACRSNMIEYLEK